MIARDTDPSSLLRLIESHRITHTVLVPTLIRNVLEAPAFSSSDLSSLRTLIYAGSPMPAAIVSGPCSATRSSSSAARSVLDSGCPFEKGATAPCVCLR